MNVMKKILLILFLCSLYSVKLSAFNADSSFAKGNEFYQKKDYAKAAASYKSALDAGYAGASLYYNLGNAYFRDGKIGYAILFYEKAAKLSPNDKDIEHNLKIANLRTIDKVAPMPPFILFRLWDKTILLFSVAGWTTLSFALYLIILISAGVYFTSHVSSYQRVSFLSGIITFLLFAGSVFFLWQRVEYQQNRSKGIIVVQTSVAKLAPDVQSKDSFVIHEGIKVVIEDKVNDWLRIRLQDGKIGWIAVNNLAVI